MMMITKMTKVSLFVLAGMISRSSAFDPCMLNFSRSQCDRAAWMCKWTGGFFDGKCSSRTSSTEAATLSFYLDQKDIVVDKNIDSYWNSGSGDEFYKNEEDMDEEGDEDSAPLDLESDGEPNVSDKKRSNLRIRTN